jgi:hypothetical protein
MRRVCSRAADTGNAVHTYFRAAQLGVMTDVCGMTLRVVPPYVIMCTA